VLKRQNVLTSKCLNVKELKRLSVYLYFYQTGGEKMPLEVSGIKLYSVGEVAEMLKSTKPTIRAYFRDSKLIGRKISGKWHITEDNLKKYLSEDYSVPIK